MAEKLRLLDLFAGVGGFSVGLEAAGGFETVAFCERDPHCQRVLRGKFPGVPIHADVTCLGSNELGPIDAVTAGFPCQDASIANPEGLGTDGNRTGLFRHAIRLVGELRPELVILENVPELLNRGFGDVLGALAEIGYDAEWDCISASALGCPHGRERLFIVAYPDGARWARSMQGRSIFVSAFEAFSKHGDPVADVWAKLVRSESVLRGSDEIPLTMERRRIGQMGNAVVPLIPELLGRAYLEAMEASNG